MIDREIEYFTESLPEWLKLYPGRVALVKDETLVGVFDCDEDAIAEGVRQFQRSPFLVRRILAKQEEIAVPALSLGILRANPDYTTIR